jgi:hypothetical protein
MPTPTICTSPLVSSPVKFLGATVLSFNTSLGLGFQESSLSVDLIEDCEAGDVFLPKTGGVGVGQPLMFPSSAPGGFSFSFGGLLTNWTVNQSNSGIVYNAKLTDPRQLLQNFAIVVDGDIREPIQAPNYFNAYAFYESSVANSNCAAFGTSLGGERGMPYVKILGALINRNPTVFSPTGFQFNVNWSDFPIAPDYYRVSGAQNALQLLQDVCDVSGLEFAVYLELGPTIRIRTIDLKQSPANFNSIANFVSSFNGQATSLSYGQELRNEKTKTIVYGDQVHYLTYVNCFNHFFGEDRNPATGEYEPIVPIRYNNDGRNFIIKKRIDELNLGLIKPLSATGPVEISEIQIRAAMASREAWDMIVFDPNIENFGLAALVRANYQITSDTKQAIDAIFTDNNLDPVGRYKALMTVRYNPNSAAAKKGKNPVEEDLNKIHQFVANLGNTFYGKQFIARLNEDICYFVDPLTAPQGNPNFGNKTYTSIPTNAGGWYEYNQNLLGLNDNNGLGVFRTDDQRVTSFAVFNIGGTTSSPPPESAKPSGVEIPLAGGPNPETFSGIA